MSLEPTRSRHLGKYELQTRLGRGGMAEVWKAFDPQLRRHVAVKLMLTELRDDPDFLVRFEREARLVASLDHPNIVRIHDFQISQPPESETPTPYMVMDYVKGQTVSDYINDTSRKGNIPPWRDIVYLFASTSRALDFAHQKGMVHRDIKPANILLDQRLPSARTMGEPILTDFGVARMQGVQTGTLLGSLVGTPLYIAPEQALGQNGDRRCDLYSLGIILYEITTGVTPFRAETTVAILMQHLHEAPTPPSLINPRIPTAVSEIILKSISKRPEDRYFSATDMTTALAQSLNLPLPGRSNSSNSSSGYNILLPDPSPAPAAQSLQTYTPTYTPSLQTHTPAHTPYFGFTSENAEKIQRQSPSQESSPAPVKSRPINRRTIIIVMLLLLALIGGGLGFVALQTNNAPHVSPIPVSGHLMFFRSTNGNYNQLQIDINNVPPPPQGYVYYAWLVGNTLENSPAHWPLVYNKGTLSLTKQSYPGYTNLFQPNSLFLVTKESAGSSPVVPYTDPQARLYYAQISTTSNTLFDIKPCPSSSTANVCSG